MKWRNVHFDGSFGMGRRMAKGLPRKDAGGRDGENKPSRIAVDPGEVRRSFTFLRLKISVVIKID